MFNHYGSSILKFEKNKPMYRCTCSCGWKSKKTFLNAEEYEGFGYKSSFHNSADNELNSHLKGLADESFDD